MAACSAGDDCNKEFNSWLSTKLLSLNEDVDLDVFVSYIGGILAETDTSDSDKEESLVDFLGEILCNDAVGIHCKEIVQKWGESSMNGKQEEAVPSDKLEQSIDAKIHKIIEQQNQQAARTRVVDAEQQKRKAAILANYAEVSDGEDSDYDPTDALPSSNTASASAASATGAASSEDLLVRNMNALLVKERENQEREKSRLDAEQKKIKDKDDRDKQKQKQHDRKDAEKKRTQKGEKRR